MAWGGTLSIVSDERWVQVAKVFDGDTFLTERGMRVRLLGINTPEVAHESKPGEPMGEAARQALRRQIEGRIVRLRFDRERKDRYGRTLAQVWRRDGTWVNAWLVEQGYAHVYTFAPNVRWSEALLALERRAIAKRRGIWRTQRFALLDAESVDSRHIGQFRVVEGVVGRRLDRRGWVFRLGRLRVSVPRRYRKWFTEPPALEHEGEMARLRGRIRAGRDGSSLYLALHLPQDLEWRP